MNYLTAKFFNIALKLRRYC